MTQFPSVVSYDLTTPEGMTFAIKDYAKNNPTKSAAMMALLLINPVVLLGAVLADKIVKSVTALFEHPEKMIEAQRKTAIDLIKAGRENGASRIKVTLNQKAGIDIGGELEGYSLKISVGSDAQMTIETEYK